MTRVTKRGRDQRLFTSGVVAAFGDSFMLADHGHAALMDWRLALITFSSCR
jgi:hypothetical protein